MEIIKFQVFYHKKSVLILEDESSSIIMCGTHFNDFIALVNSFGLVSAFSTHSLSISRSLL